MKRHESLHDLSRDHFDALVHAREMKRAAGGAEGAPPPEEAGQRFLDFWNDHARMHFVEEEEVLLPIYARHRSLMDDPDIRTMLSDHAWIRDRVSALRRGLDARSDITALVGDIGKRLHDHVRLEERAVFEEMQRVLTEEDMEDVRTGSLEFRRQLRGKGSIGPGGERRFPLPTEADLDDRE